MAQDVHPVDEILPAPKLLALGLQHVLVMYAGAVAVPLIVGRALNLSPEQVAILISADLFACGVATLIQTIGFPGVGIRLPVMMGVTFASVSPMLAMAANADVGLLGIYGAVIAAGIFGVVVAPFISRMLPLFPPVVTGTIIVVIGISLMRVGINWAGGGIPMLDQDDRGHRRGPGGQSCLRCPGRNRDRRLRSRGRAGVDPLRQGFRRQRRRAAGHRRRCGGRRLHGQDAFRQGRRCAAGSG